MGELKKQQQWNAKMMVVPIAIGAPGAIPKGLIKGVEDFEIKGQVETNWNYSIIKSGQNTAKIHENLMRIVVIQTPGINHELTLMWKTKTRRKNLAMAWIDYQKVYGMVPHSWIINSLKMYKISDEIINFIDKTMKTWRFELTAGGRRLAEAKIQRGIFQGDALSPILFIIFRGCVVGHEFSPTTQQYSNIKIINKNFRFWKNYILETCNQHLIELIFKPVLTYLNVFSYWHYLQNYI